MFNKIINWFAANPNDLELEAYIQRKRPTNLAELEQYLRTFYYRHEGDYL